MNIASRLEKLANPGGVCIEDSVYKQVKGKLAAYAFKDCGEFGLHNIPEPVRVYLVYRPTSPADTSPRLSTKPLDPRLDQASITVLPFENTGSEHAQGDFADGLTEAIIRELLNDTSLSIRPLNSTLAYQGELADVKRVAKELDADYVLVDNTRRFGERLRVSVQLIDAINGRIVGAEHYDHSVADSFGFQDKIARQIVPQMVTHFHLAGLWARNSV